VTARVFLAALLLALWPLAAARVAMAACTTMEHEGRSYDVCRFNPAEEPLGLYNLGADGEPIANFSSLAAHLASDGMSRTARP